jgi:STAS domain
MGNWVEVMEQCWKRVAESSPRPLVVDLTAVTFADCRGLELLSEMYRGGAELRAGTCWGKGVVEQIKSRTGTLPEKGR